MGINRGQKPENYFHGGQVTIFKAQNFTESAFRENTWVSQTLIGPLGAGGINLITTKGSKGPKQGRSIGPQSVIIRIQGFPQNATQCLRCFYSRDRYTPAHNNQAAAPQNISRERSNHASKGNSNPTNIGRPQQV